ncbi:MAG: VanW family protein [Spirochaetes bacterium]|nr:VanW family protein [Spirochaetota bacterium]
MPRNRRLFCEINPTCYFISLQKEIAKRYLKNLLSKEKFAKTIKKEELPNIVFSQSLNMIKRAKSVDLTTQENKMVNIKLACNKINGIIIRPGEVFSFWKTVGKTSAKNGYKNGRIIQKNRIILGTGGGLCNLANTTHLLVLHSPLQVIEFHNHSDALAPDEGKRIPFNTGTSVRYNHIDYRFKNNTDQDFQLLLWCEGEILHAELRSEREFPYYYKLAEENHHFKKKGDKYYRISEIYKEISDKLTGNILDRKLVLDNHSEVLYDYTLIPKDQIRE